MKNSNKWKMSRTGLLNFWYYDDEIFDFADGKLLLRGSNGSGKSVTMQSILPVLLDGKKSPDRLDPFGSRARKMEDYLLGEKEVSNRDERTGYLFLEYKREDTNQYITTGIGLQARRHKTMNSWYFVIHDNRRIGKDLFLYELENQAGKQQKIPLSRIQLENRVGDGGHVVKTQTEYMKLVNKYIFGFEDLDAYDDLIKLLIQLRSPKLSKDFKPTVIYDILEAALPPLTDEDLRHLSDTIEHMDQTKQQIEQLDRENLAISKLIKQYSTYNEYRLASHAQEYLQSKKRLQRTTLEHDEHQTEIENLQNEISELQASQKKLNQSIEILNGKSERLKEHKVWKLEQELTAKKNEHQELTQNISERTKKVDIKKRQELEAKDRLEAMELAIADGDQEMENLLLDLEADAEVASFENHSINVGDFQRNKKEKFDFIIWRNEADKHYKKLDDLANEFDVYEKLKDEIGELRRAIGEYQMDLDQHNMELGDWSAIFNQDKQEKLAEVHQWTEKYSFLSVTEVLLQQVSRDMEQLYEPLTYEKIRSPFVQLQSDYQLRVNQQIAKQNHLIESWNEKWQGKEEELREWKAKKDPEPPFQLEATKEARQLLEQHGHSFLPLYEAVEFQQDVPEKIKQQIEAMLLDSGLLNALITDKNFPLKHDKIILPEPKMMAHTLADYLVPDLDEDARVSYEQVDNVLRSIVVDTEEENTAFGLFEDGTYQLGLLKGHAVPVEAVRFIGKSARKRYREEQIKLLEEEIVQIQEKLEQVKEAKQELVVKIDESKQALDEFPNDADLAESFGHMKEKRFLMEQLTKEIQRMNQKLETLLKQHQELKRKLENDTRHFNLHFTQKAYKEAKMIMRNYERSLSELRTIHTAYLHETRSLTFVNQQLRELENEIIELQGELNSERDRETVLQANLREVENQLQLHGVEEIRKQIREVQMELLQAKRNLRETGELLPRKEAKQESLQEKMEQDRRKISFLNKISASWLAAFSNESHYQFVEIPEELDAFEDQIKWISNNYYHLLKEKDLSKIEGQLTSAYFEQHSNLMEYRMREINESVTDVTWDEQEWTDEEQILIGQLQAKSSRRIIQLDFQGKLVSPYYIKEQIEKDQMEQQYLLDAEDRRLYEEILFDSVGRKLRSRIRRAQNWTEKIDDLMQKSDSSSGLSFSLRWKPRTAETESELDTKQLVELLQRDARLLKDEDVNQVIEHFRSKINRAKELVEVNGEGSTLLQVLKEVLDYRHWFSFVLSFKREREQKRELTNQAFFKFSGGEKAMAMYIPLFTACYSRYLEADRSAPYIISLDEAFAGVDEDNISVMFRIVEELDFDYIMNSQVLWGDYETVSSLSICELVRPKNADFVTVIRYLWNGTRRKLVVDDADPEVAEISGY